MAKYSEQFKLMVVREYQEGYLGYDTLAKKHCMTNSSPIKRWVKLYEKFGIEGLKRIRQKKVYSVQFKLEVLSFYEENRFFRNGNSPSVWYNKPSNDKFMAQGWHYQHRSWVKTLKKNNVFQSMSRKGNCIDNSPMENFFGLLKQEMYHGEARSSYEDLKKKIEEHIDYYNNKRIKQKLAGMSPVQYRIHTCQLAA